MNIVSFLSSLNKIGLVAFLITLGFLLYEVILLRKASQAKAKPQVPQFQEGVQVLPSAESNINDFDRNAIKKNNLVLLILVILLTLFGAITVIGYFNLKASSQRLRQTRNIKAAIPVLSPTKVPTPTLKKFEPTIRQSQTPTDVPATTFVSPTLTETSVPSPSPTLIEQLPVTGIVDNSLVLFSLAGLLILFSFLF